VVGAAVAIGPYAHLRPGARIGARSEIGNYAEVKASSLGPGTRMHHMSYVGDAEVGENVNIGAGTITCNYDGKQKNRTVIGDGAFIGSDTMLRAPVSIGAGAYTGAGSVVTRDVAAGEVVAGVPAKPLRKPSHTEAGDGGA
jgi:bifunctional UDP-N-acetylglucosamine pyrophosphorylase / glucosamine-1-phosphate N-acetyltransferase